MEHALLWLKFLAAGAVVVLAGLNLTRDAERLATALGWGHAFAGFVILGWATSLPEMTISVSAVTAVQSASLSAGNITGSIIFNLGILGALDWIVRGRISRGWRVRDGSHIQGVVPLGIFNLVMLAGLFVVALLPDAFSGHWRWSAAVWLTALYVLATLHSWWTERDGGGDDRRVLPQPEDIAEIIDGEPLTRRSTLVMRCIVAAAAILATGLWLTQLGEAIATTYQLEAGFVGSLFLAVTSSLPEMVTGYAAAKLGLHAMAAGSILGSNIFNLAILGVCDMLWLNGPGGGLHLLQAAAVAEPGRMERNLAFAIAMTGVALYARYRQRDAPGHRPSRVLAALTLVLCVVVMSRA